MPESALRNRTRENVTLDTKVGVETLFTESEEKLLVDYVKYMASIDYGYNKSGVQYMARDYVISMNKSVKSKDSISNSWFYEFFEEMARLKNCETTKTCNA